MAYREILDSSFVCCKQHLLAKITRVLFDFPVMCFDYYLKLRLSLSIQCIVLQLQVLRFISDDRVN